MTRHLAIPVRIASATLTPPPSLMNIVTVRFKFWVERPSTRLSHQFGSMYFFTLMYELKARPTHIGGVCDATALSQFPEVVLRSPLPLVPDSRIPGVSVQFPHPVPLSIALVPSAFTPEARGSRFSPRTQRGGTLRPSCLAHRRPPNNIPVRCGPADRPLGGRPSYGQHSWYHTGMDVS